MYVPSVCSSVLPAMRMSWLSCSPQVWDCYGNTVFPLPTVWCVLAFWYPLFRCGSLLALLHVSAGQG